MPRCSAARCRNMGAHTFPKDPHLRRVWEKATNKENFTASKHSRLCAGHFKPNDYVERCLSTGLAPSHRYLKKTAVPSIFLCNIQTSTTTIGRKPKKKTTLQTISSSSTNLADDKSTEKTRHSSVRLRNRKAYLENRRCSVPQCNSRPSNEVSLHPCPNNAAVRSEWAEALRVSYQYVKTMVACSLHFMKMDFIQSKNAERVLKLNAVPSRNLPHNKKVAVTVKDKPMKKVVATEDSDRQKTMTDIVGEELVVPGGRLECRACLAWLDDKSCCDVFQAWSPPWEGMEATIAEDLSKLANVEISMTDRHSKVLCLPCYQRLVEAASFAFHVRRCDLILRMRFTPEIDMEKVWPKPIQVDKNISGSVFINSMDVEIKQEVLSDEEYPVNGTDNAYVENELPNLDIKIEPEEFVEPPPMNITINGTVSLDPFHSENKYLTNGTDLHQETEYLERSVKQEPMSDGEQETEQAPDLSLDCLLCTKAFNSVTGLKAHVIAQHSYKTVKRKTDGSDSPQKKRGLKSYECAICRRNFQTRTDLMVHETCHNKHVCYGCTQKFDSFKQLSRHRKWCKPCITNSVQKLITLKDVTRLQDEKNEYLESEMLKKQSDDINQEDCIIKDIKKEIVENELNDASELIEMKEVIDKKEDKSEKKQAESNVKCENTDVECEVECKKDELNCENKEAGCEKNVKCENEVAECENELAKCENKETESIEKDTESQKKEEKQEDTDSKMKLLEILSSNEPVLKVVDMQVETLENDDCT